MRSLKSGSLWIGAFLSVALISASGILRFEAWTQVMDLWDTEISPFLLIGHPHFFRYMVAYPGFLLEDKIPGFGFSIYIGIFFATNVSIFRRLIWLASNRSAPVLAWTVFISSHLFMNGRGVIAWTAWLLCAYLCLRISRGESISLAKLLLIALACLLAAVSTGVFIVTVVTITIFTLSNYKHAVNRSKWRVFLFALLFIPIAVVIADFFWVAIEKNLDFYGGGFEGAINMLNHGLGGIFSGSTVSTILAMWLIGLTLSTIIILVLHGWTWKPLQKLIFLAFFGGLFGFTVLTLAIPVLLVYFTTGRRRRQVFSPPPSLQLRQTTHT